MENTNKRKLVLPAFIIFLMTMNYFRLKGSECIRPIHIVTLLALGAAIGVLLVNIISLIKEKKN
ncbi:MAG TPA: hypothetical protein VK489_06725 [Ferruginibacter sp.]|nr:hypothetical protein [Ferruginibacter sp.]